MILLSHHQLQTEVLTTRCPVFGSTIPRDTMGWERWWEPKSSKAHQNVIHLLYYISSILLWLTKLYFYSSTKRASSSIDAAPMLASFREVFSCNNILNQGFIISSDCTICAALKRYRVTLLCWDTNRRSGFDLQCMQFVNDILKMLHIRYWMIVKKIFSVHLSLTASVANIWISKCYPLLVSIVKWKCDICICIRHIFLLEYHRGRICVSSMVIFSSLSLSNQKFLCYRCTYAFSVTVSFELVSRRRYYNVDLT